MFSHGMVNVSSFYTEHTEVLELPFKGDFSDLKMMVVRPINETTLDLHQVERELTPELIMNWEDRFEKRMMLLEMPVFEMSYEMDASKILKTMGVTDLFNPAQSDMGDMTKDHPPVYEDAFDREGWIKLNADGVEGAAMTGDGPTDPAMHTQLGKQVYHAARPFIYLILDAESETLLFQGRVTNPNGWKMKRPTPHHHGAIWLVLLILMVLGCGGGYFYNTRYNGLSGTDAVPCISICRQCGASASRPGTRCPTAARGRWRSRRCRATRTTAIFRPRRPTRSDEVTDEIFFHGRV